VLGHFAFPEIDVVSWFHALGRTVAVLHPGAGPDRLSSISQAPPCR
jgi:hypothetical protein